MSSAAARAGAMLAPFSRNLVRNSVKSDSFGHQSNLDIHLHTVEIHMIRLLLSRLIRMFTVCSVDLFFIQYFL